MPVKEDRPEQRAAPGSEYLHFALLTIPSVVCRHPAVYAELVGLSTPPSVYTAL